MLSYIFNSRRGATNRPTGWGGWTLRRLVPVLLLFFVADRAIAYFLMRGIEQYYGMDGTAHVACIGHSRTVLGLSESKLEQMLQLQVAKFATNGAGIFDRAHMVRYFLDIHPETKLLLYDVESSMFSSGLSANSFQLLLPFMNHPSMTEYVRSEDPSGHQIRKLIHTNRFNEVTVSLALRGWFNIRSNLKSGTFRADQFRQDLANNLIRPPDIDLMALQAFSETVAYARNAGVEVILWHPPTIAQLNAIRSKDREAVRRIFADIALKQDGVYYIELAHLWEKEHELFFDSIHLNSDGKDRLTDLIAEYLGKWKHGQLPAVVRTKSAGLERTQYKDAPPL